MGEKLLPPYGGSNRKKCDICDLTKTHTNATFKLVAKIHNLSYEKGQKNTIRDSSLHRSIASYCQQRT